MSFGRARSRLAGAKRRRGTSAEASAVDRGAGETVSTMKHLAINSSQFGDDRPLSAIQVKNIVPRTGSKILQVSQEAC